MKRILLAAVAAFADVLRMELSYSDVRVCLVSPGLTDTGLRAANPAESLARMSTAATNLAGVAPLAPDRIAEADCAGFRSLSATMALAMTLVVAVAEKRSEG